MDYLLCIPARETNTRENCEKIHNVLARMSDTYKLRIVPEPVKNKQFPCPPYYKKYRIYKPVKERDTNGEAYLEKEEEEMLLSSCKTEEEQELCVLIRRGAGAQQVDAGVRGHRRSRYP